MFEDELDPDPIGQFADWYAHAQAAGVPQTDAMALATATTTGIPAARMVLLKGHDDRGFVFFTNRESRKGGDLTVNPVAALLFFWQPLRRQVRIEGRVEEISEAETDAYFLTRPRGSQIAAWSSPQSEPVSDRAELDRLYDATEARLAGVEMTTPPFWGGYRVVPSAIEFWQGRENRLHDRLRYERVATGWTRMRLAP
jgi:pyridoxamine 5'-phosphate oxidase